VTVPAAAKAVATLLAPVTHTINAAAPKLPSPPLPKPSTPVEHAVLAPRSSGTAATAEENVAAGVKAGSGVTKSATSSVPLSTSTGATGTGRNAMPAGPISASAPAESVTNWADASSAERSRPRPAPAVPGAIGSPAAGSASSGGTAGPAGEPASGYGLGSVPAGTPPAGAPSHRAGNDGGRTARLRAAVVHLQGCLADLPRRQRIALTLRAGLGASGPLGVVAAARRLHISAKRFAALERRGLAGLRSAARAHGCATAVSAGTSETSVRFVVGETGSVAAGGVEATRYATPPSGDAEKHIPSIVVSSPQSVVPHLARDAAVGVLVLIIASMLFISFLAADSLGLGPRYPEWRRRQRGRWRRLWR
jgi:hypothetical protein